MVLNSELEMDEAFWYLPQILQSGILNKPNHSRDLKDLRKRLGNDTLAIELFQEIAKSLPDIVDSGLALTSLDRILVLTQSPAETVKDWLTEKSKFRRFIRLLGSSSFLSQILIQQYPDIMNLNFFQDQHISRDRLVQLAISLTCKRQSEKEVTDVLRKFRLEWTLVIASADLLDHLGIAPPDPVQRILFASHHRLFKNTRRLSQLFICIKSRPKAPPRRQPRPFTDESRTNLSVLRHRG